MNSQRKIDKVLFAVSDRKRRKIIELLHSEQRTIQDLTESFSISIQAVSKHVKVLEEAGILFKKKQGKFVLCSLHKEAFREPLEWISIYADFWNESFDQLELLMNEKKVNK